MNLYFSIKYIVIILETRNLRICRVSKANVCHCKSVELGKAINVCKCL